MSSENVDKKNLRVTEAGRTPGADKHVRIEDDAFVVVTQAYGPAGDQLVGISDVSFDGFPAVTLRVVADGREGLVHLSPIHGDRRKAGFTDIPEGTKCALYCPVSGRPLDALDSDERPGQADFFAIYLTPRLSKGDLVAISDVWGHYSSQIIDNSELISSWVADGNEAP